MTYWVDNGAISSELETSAIQFLLFIFFCVCVLSFLD